MKTRQTGFTLIELIMVIAILGILAAFAMPRFANLGTEARVAAVSGLQGSIQAAAAVAHSIQLAQNLTPGTSVTMEGQVVTMSNGYPTADAAGIEVALVSISGFTHDGAGLFTKDGAPTAATCSVTYNAALANASPVITSATGGC